MKKIGDYWVPNADVRTAKKRKKVEADFGGGKNGRQITHLLEALELVEKHSTRELKDTIAVDAGANVGSYTRLMSEYFSKVISLEPAPDTFACLERNVYEWGILPKVYLYMAAVSDKRNYIKMGASFGRRSISRKIVGKGNIPSIPLDSLGLSGVSFIKLDVEGHEENAIIGARGLLASSKPFVMMEVKEEEEVSKTTPFAAHKRLVDFGYELIAKLGEREIDWLYKPV